MSDSFSEVDSLGAINSVVHTIGKIGDAETVFTEFDQNTFLEKIKTIPDNTWIGTHCWPGSLDLSNFNKVIAITTTTHRSKCYRWLRVYHHYFSKKWDLLQFDSCEKKDKIRETAKNYLIPFDAITAPNLQNIEFADIVENTKEFTKLVQEKNLEKHLYRWKQVNHFLYDENLWNSDLIKIFYQAELEVNLKRYYVYE